MTFLVPSQQHSMVRPPDVWVVMYVDTGDLQKTKIYVIVVVFLHADVVDSLMHAKMSVDTGDLHQVHV